MGQTANTAGFIIFHDRRDTEYLNYIYGGDYFGDFISTSDTAGSTSTQATHTVYESIFQFTHITTAMATDGATGFKLKYKQVPCGQRVTESTDKLAGA